MSSVDATKDYAVEVAKTALNGFNKQARGDLEAPNGDENVRLYTAKGGSAVTLASGTTSAAVVFDPEASIRNGQMNVCVYERDTNDAVTAVQTVNLGRSSNEFLSVGVMSSGLKVFNSSGVDVIGGTQTAAVLTSVPKDISSITTTDVSNFCSNHERDVASGIVSREDSTMTVSMTEHLGRKMCLSRTDTIGNVVTRTWDDSVSTRRTTSGKTGGFAVDTTVTPVSDSSDDTVSFATLLASHNSGTNKMIFDSSRLDDIHDPLTLATYNARLKGYIRINAGTGSAYDDYMASFRIMGLSAANEIVSESGVRDITTVKASDTFDLTFDTTFSSSAKPIARVVAFWSRYVGPDVTEAIRVQDTVFTLSSLEETADIPARPIHVCVFEGLNNQATLNINSTAVLTGVPDSTNVFISSATSANTDMVDGNAVEMFLRSVIRGMPRAFTVAGHGSVERSVDALFGTEEVALTFKAMSFSDITKGLKTIGSRAKDAKRVAEQALPFVDDAARIASMMPGPVGAAGSMIHNVTRRM
uniref:Uncharacterized protein n=1 Tax=viral metagenome TaxID=1070528 RepID=A0A2V0RIX9_9ZZZZ